MIFTTGYSNLPFWFLIVWGTIIDPSPSINPAKYPANSLLLGSLDNEELESKEGSDVLFELPTYK